jgi:chromatin remodeling complex protein RSC6
MNNDIRHKLRELIVEYGSSLCNEPARCEALLKDYCGAQKREIYVLVSALKKRVTDDMLKSRGAVPQEIIMRRLCKRLEDELALTVEAAQWAVESWALALGFVTTFLPIPAVKDTRGLAKAANTSQEATVVLTPSAALAAVIGSDLVGRPQAIKKLWNYIKAKKLQDRSNNRAINADVRLLAIFGKPQVTIFELAGIVSKHLDNAKVTYAKFSD